MGRTATRLPGFCLNRIRPHVKVRSPPIQHKVEASNPHKITNEKTENSSEEKPGGGGGGGSGSDEKPVKVIIPGRKIMIVVDSSAESKGALQWALSHTVQSQDTVVLLHVTKTTTQQATCEECSKEAAPRAYQLVESLKNMCQLKKPEVNIESIVVQGKEKGPTIVEEARKHRAALLVLGQKKQSMTWRLLIMWTGNRFGGFGFVGGGGGGGGFVEYCVQNADCMAIAVRRKNKVGGYLITTKRQKDFWLLA